LKKISSATANSLSINDEAATAVVEALGVSSNAPGDAVVVLGELGGVASVWTDEFLDMAWLEASAGVVAAAAGESEKIASRFFNAGISLINVDGEPMPLILARGLLNSLGVRWSMRVSRDLREAMVNNDGLSCAVNLIGSVLQYRVITKDQSSPWPELWAAAEALAALPRVLPADPSTEVDFARIQGASRQLRLQPVEEFSEDTLVDLLDRVIEVLRPRGSKVFGNPALDTAAAVGGTFRETLNRSSGSVEGLVAEMETDRREPVAVFLRRFEPYVSSRRDLPGRLLISAGLASESDVLSMSQRLLEGPDSIGDELRSFSPIPSIG
jgi:hypothetical protein